MDAFYASVELLRRPQLRGLPVAIGGRGDTSRRGVVTTASYEARQFGIRSGMALRKAAELCPQCVFVPVDFDEYRRFSRRFKAAIAGVCPIIEDRGIDEVYLELTPLLAEPGSSPQAIGRALKAAVFGETGLTCSVGIAPNKLLAKIASDLEKPDGLTMIWAADVATRIWPLPARKINGIGPKASERLAALGIHTIGELAATPPQQLLDHFGRHYGHWLHEASHGRDGRAVVTFSEPKSLSRETTFERDLHLKHDWHALAAMLARLCHQVQADLVKKGYHARTVGIKVRFDNFQIATRDLSLTHPTQDTVAIRKAAFECLARVPQPCQRLRLIGVRLGNLVPNNGLAATERGPGMAQADPVSTDASRRARPGAGRTGPDAGSDSRNLTLF